VILHRHMHRTEDSIGCVGGTGDEQEVAAWHGVILDSEDITVWERGAPVRMLAGGCMFIRLVAL